MKELFPKRPLLALSDMRYYEVKLPWGEVKVMPSLWMAWCFLIKVRVSMICGREIWPLLGFWN